MPIVTHQKLTKPSYVRASLAETDIFYHAKCKEMADRVLRNLRDRAAKTLKTGRPVVILDAFGETIEECIT